MSILSEVFTDGEFNESLLDIYAMSMVQHFVFFSMKIVLDARNKIKIVG